MKNNLKSFFRGTLIGLVIVFMYAFISPRELLAECSLPACPANISMPTFPPMPTLPPGCGHFCGSPTPTASPIPTVTPSSTPTVTPTPTTPTSSGNDNGTGGAPLSPAGPPQAPPYVSPAVLGLSTTSSGVASNPYFFWLGCVLLSGGFFFLLKK